MKQKRVADVMQRHVVRVAADDPLSSVSRLFADEQISGAPVVSETGLVVGVVSMSDIVRSAGEEVPYSGTEAAFYRQIRASQPHWLDEPDELAGRLTDLRVSDVMTPELVSIAPDAPISELAKLITDNHVHRVLVIEDTPDGADLVGIVSVFDLVRLLE